MSGGAFDYRQHHIGEIADQIEHEIEKNGKPKSKKKLDNQPYFGADYYKENPEELNYYKYPDEVIEKFKEAVKALRIAEIYAQRVDWILSSDDNEESFLKRLEKELKNLK
jgi:hypothetical protein